MEKSREKAEERINEGMETRARMGKKRRLKAKKLPEKNETKFARAQQS